MTDGFEETDAPRKTKAPRKPYVRTGLDDQLLVVRQVMSKLQKLKNKDARLRALKMVTEEVEAEV